MCVQVYLFSFSVESPRNLGRLNILLLLLLCNGGDDDDDEKMLAPIECE